MINAAFNNKMKGLLLSVLLGFSLPVTHSNPDAKLTPAEIVAKHLESIGSPEARARVHGTRITGNASVSVRLCGEGQVDGQVMMGSQGPLNLINMNFDAAGYPFESLKFDGKKFTASQFKPGSRTCLAQFFLTNDQIFKEGLVGGTLSESWPLFNLQERNPKLEYGGLKRVADRELHAIKYSPRKGSDLKIVLYFDPETFQHVRTEYSRTIYASEQRRIAGGGGSLPAATNQQASSARIDAFEDFADFKSEEGLILPHTYKFQLSVQSEVRPALVTWVFNLVRFTFNSPFDVSEFSLKEAQTKEKPD